MKPVDAVNAVERPDPAEHLGLVRMCVHRSPRYRSRLAKLAAAGQFESVEESEEYAEGCVGLMDAVHTFDPSKGRFSTYAANCINNAILAIGKYERAEKRDPSRELLEVDCIRDNDGRTPLDFIPSRGVSDPVEMLIQRERAGATKQMVQRMLSRLTPRNRQVVELHYLHGLCFREIGGLVNPPIKQAGASFLARRAVNVMREHAERRGIEW